MIPKAAIELLEKLEERSDGVGPQIVQIPILYHELQNYALETRKARAARHASREGKAQSSGPSPAD